MRICVYGAASPFIDKEYIKRVEELGRRLAERGHSLVFGGGANGLMGAVARGVKEKGGYILGVTPKFFFEDTVESLYLDCDELFKPDTMRERKQLMEDNADAFIVTPGGIGTYEEFFEILTSKQLCRHSKPIAVYNTLGFYDDIQRAMESAISKGFIKETCKDIYLVSEDVDEIFRYIEGPATDFGSVKELKDG